MLPGFIKLAPPFTEESFDPAVAENWIIEVEKAFSTCQTPEELKMPLTEFQLKERAHDWRSTKNMSLQEEVN